MPTTEPPPPGPATPDASGGDAVVDLVDAVAVLGRFPALAGASLTVARGEIVLLRGPNGAGKTTLLRVCAGLVPITRGEGRVAGCDLRTERDDVRRRVGLLGHANGLYGDLTVRENVRFWGATVGADASEIDASLERLGLAGRLAEVPVQRLSAGQKRRTALACLVARRAQLWLLDEPHAGLDAAGRDDLDDTLPDPDREFGAERDLGSLVPLPASVIRASGVPEGEARFRHDHAALDNSGSDRVEGAQTAVPLSPGRVDRHHVAGRGLLKADVLR